MSWIASASMDRETRLHRRAAVDRWQPAMAATCINTACFGRSLPDTLCTPFQPIPPPPAAFSPSSRVVWQLERARLIRHNTVAAVPGFQSPRALPGCETRTVHWRQRDTARRKQLRNQKSKSLHTPPGANRYVWLPVWREEQRPWSRGHQPPAAARGAPVSACPPCRRHGAPPAARWPVY